MRKPTNRALLSDAERIMRELMSGRDLYVYDDVRNWLVSRAMQVSSKGSKTSHGCHPSRQGQ
jgi:hypothetical protein